jgi:uncharacterized membrane protein
MTASKSSRARKARAQSSAARSGTTARSGTQVKTGPAVTTNGGSANGSATVKAAGPPKAASASRNGAGGGTVQARGGSRPPVSRDELAGSASTTGTTVPLWLQLTTFLLALAGLGVSIYLTIAHFTESTLAGCSETSGLVNCTKVTTSPQSDVFGVPVALLGLVFYVFAVAIMSPWAWRSTSRELHLVRLASMVVGIGFVVYLLYAELFIIGSICLYCTSVHVITFVLFVLTMFAAAAWGLGPARQSS